MEKRKFVIRLLLSLAVSGLLIFLSLRHADLRAMGNAISTADRGPVLGYLVILLVVHVVKTARWWLLLLPLGPVSFRRANAASAVGFMMLVTLPLRLGELVRPLLVARPYKGDQLYLPRSGAIASCVIERIVDCLAMGVLGIVSLHMLAASGYAADFARHAATLVTIGFTLLCVLLALAFFVREPTVAAVRAILRPFSQRLANRIAKMVDGFIRGLHLGSATRVVMFLLLTAAYWGLHVWGFWLVAGAFGLPLTLLMTCTVLASQVVGLMIPAGPGMVGTSQFFIQLGLSIFIPGALSEPEIASRAAGYANVIWLLQFGQQALTGIPFLIAGVSLEGLFKPFDNDPALRTDNA